MLPDDYKDFLNKIPPGTTGGYFKYANMMAINHGCHASFTPGHSSKYIVSGLCPSVQQQSLAEKFWNWISGPISPWRLLFQGEYQPKIYLNDGLFKGWYIEGKAQEYLPENMLKNFAILTRSFTEKNNKYIIWEMLLNKGLDPRDAFYICSSLFYGNGAITHDSTSIAGGHWPITDYTPPRKDMEHIYPNNRLNWKIFYSGQINTSPVHNPNSYYNQKINYLFELRDSKSDYLPFNPYQELSLKEFKGRFSSIKSFDLDEIIDKFNKWKSVYVKT
jgi:hypothetical protein